MVFDGRSIFFAEGLGEGRICIKARFQSQSQFVRLFSRRHDYVTFLCVLKCVDAQKASSFKAFCYLEADAKRQDETREFKFFFEF